MTTPAQALRRALWRDEADRLVLREEEARRQPKPQENEAEPEPEQ